MQIIFGISHLLQQAHVLCNTSKEFLNILLTKSIDLIRLATFLQIIPFSFSYFFNEVDEALVGSSVWLSFCPFEVSCRLAAWLPHPRVHLKDVSQSNPVKSPSVRIINGKVHVNHHLVVFIFDFGKHPIIFLTELNVNL